MDRLMNLAGAIVTLAGITVIMTSQHPVRRALDARRPRWVPERWWRWYFRDLYAEVGKLPTPAQEVMGKVGERFADSLRKATDSGEGSTSMG